MRRLIFLLVFVFVFVGHIPLIALAGEITVENVMTRFEDGQGKVTLDISWNGSWRRHGDPGNWDAAWVFVKYRLKGGMGWRHATLSAKADDYDFGNGNPVPATIQPGRDGKGFFVFRAKEGAGDIHWKGLQIPWEIKDDGLTKDRIKEMRVFALEMVYIPQGSFLIGDGVSQGTFHAGGRPKRAFQVTEKPIILKNSEGGLWADASQGDLPTGIKAPSAWDNPSGVVSPQYPTGYKAFYVMKYEITQGQYAAFLNSLGKTQAVRRYPARGSGKFRFTIVADQDGKYSTSIPSRACNWINWEDGIAFADWAALRPMTELEFEKICRGRGPSIPGEYAWGTTKIISMTGFKGEDGTGNETAVPDDANTLYLKTIMGPVRVGIFEGKKTRELSGVSYYGVPDLSGNVIEMAVTLGNPAGRKYEGSHGDGSLNEAGDADAPLWPHARSSPFVAPSEPEQGGFGYRGGDFYNPEADLRVSDRHVAAFHSARRLFGLGFRAVRSEK